MASSYLLMLWLRLQREPSKDRRRQRRRCINESNKGVSQSSRAMTSTDVRSRFASYFDITNFDSTVPQPIQLGDKKNLFTFQKLGSDNYPPHLDLVPDPIKTGIDFLQIFNFMRLLDTGLLLPRMIPEKIIDFIHDSPESGTMAGIEQRNKEIRIANKDIGKEPNIGDRSDWYRDAVFAQQFFTGPNPTTIEQASNDWIEQFRNEAKRQSSEKFAEAAFDLLKSADAGSLYIQDYSYFREAVKATAEATLASDDGQRFACAAVCLFQLSAEGKLHPLAIVLDYKGSMEKSVVLFNRRLRTADSTADESTDWPWRYAKFCVQISDWTQHELTIHLTNTHLVEEVVIVAAHRSFKPDHIVFRLLEPHWLKTLPLNAAARSSLVPGFIVDINGMSSAQTYAFISDSYKRFDWKAHYIPTDLPSRGFPLSELNSNPKFHNYVYGKNMALLWIILRKFVSSALRKVYTSDSGVLNDEYIQGFVHEMKNPDGGNMGEKFPEIEKVEELIDMVTMCIHIASPQHTAVNYLQDYYQAFVPNKLGCLCSELPSSLSALKSYAEPDMMRALPINHPRIWLMSSHLPYLLSYRVAEEQTLLNYALSLSRLAGSAQGGNDPIVKAGPQLLSDLVELREVFKRNSEEMDDQTLPYNVLDPGATAISILL
jgi:hypothetical protein